MQRRALGLRLRLTLVYALFCAVILTVVGVVFRHTLLLTLRQNSEAVLAEEWAAARGYLRFEKQKPVWFYDRQDEEESAIVLRFRQGMLLIADRDGKVLEVSDAYTAIGVDPPAEVHEVIKMGKAVLRERRDEDGNVYLLRSGVQTDDDRKPYYVALGHSLNSDESLLAEFTRRYLWLAPVLLFTFGVASWWAAGRALRPLHQVAKTAQAVTGENLGPRIERRGAGDELDHLIDTFNSMVDRLEESFNQIRRFTMDVSHELRTPLTAIRGGLEVALMTANSKEQYREAMMAAMEDVDRLTQVVRALLHLSQAESGQVVVARDPLDLSVLAAEVVEQFEIPAETEGLELESRLEAGAVVAGDRIQVGRLLSNLLSNAIKYTPTGGRITVGTRISGSEVELTVADTGRGIPAEHLPHIFDRFYRVPDGIIDPDKGLGLGLSFVAWIAKAHGARISVDSTPGKGTTFTVMFSAMNESGDRIVV